MITKTDLDLISMLQSSDYEVLDLAARLLVRMPKEWLELKIPWNLYEHPDINLTGLCHNDRGTLKRNYRKPIFMSWDKDMLDCLYDEDYTFYEEIEKSIAHNFSKLYIRDDKALFFLMRRVCYRSLPLMKCHKYFDVMKKVYV